MEQKKVNGMECPVCVGFIPVDIEQLLYDGVIACPNCGLRLTVNRQQSQAAMNALKKVDDAVKRVDSTSKFKR